jgi:putative FmdB family regulatory protein
LRGPALGAHHRIWQSACSSARTAVLQHPRPGRQRPTTLTGRPPEDIVPTYQYACTQCNHRFEAVQAFTDDSLTVCPECGGSLRKVYGSVGVVFKGSGFYRTDSRVAAGAAAGADKAGGDSAGGDKAGGDNGGDKAGGDKAGGEKKVAASTGSSDSSGGSKAAGGSGNRSSGGSSGGGSTSGGSSSGGSSSGSSGASKAAAS